MISRRNFAAGAAALAASPLLPALAAPPALPQAALLTNSTFGKFGAPAPDRPEIKKDFLTPAALYEAPFKIVRDNQKTLVFRTMERWEMADDSAFAGSERIRIRWAQVDSDAYRQWVEEGPHECPPHIVWGGFVAPVPGGADPATRREWLEFANSLA